ncbi:hypothetical protein ASPFODRAFT_266352 [Aspergillus luchuensis CBS 106.47]|uniref:Uncharacterized protein n=1 Tax=Aspergillus luchuensis (strain CBS 106.47) TaxID=1137211 RepID=A0A1M3U0U0_ASPLC|nr:hypothetical protein ASPFODRAFT_266352 [Aspergillus luchuensis CBS 106.47]
MELVFITKYLILNVCSKGTLQLVVCAVFKTIGSVICILVVLSSCSSASEIYISAGRYGVAKGRSHIESSWYFVTNNL